MSDLVAFEIFSGMKASFSFTLNFCKLIQSSYFRESRDIGRRKRRRQGKHRSDLIEKVNMVHVTPFQIFKEVDINDMADMELRAFEARLDTMVDQLAEESTELIIERPRYAHAVMVFANSDEPGELLTASRIKVLDPIYIPVGTTTNGHQIFHHFSEDMNVTEVAESTSNLNECDDGEHCEFVSTMENDDDDDIQKALKKLEESKNMLDDPIILSATSAILPSGSESSTMDGYGTTRSKMPQFPSQLRNERRTSASSGHT